MSSISTSSGDEGLEKLVVERKPGVQIEEPPIDLHYVRHNVLDYALFLCRGRKSPRLNSNMHDVGTDHSESNTRLVVLDESGMFQEL